MCAPAGTDFDGLAPGSADCSSVSEWTAVWCDDMGCAAGSDSECTDCVVSVEVWFPERV